MKKKRESLISFSSLVQAFTPTRKIYRKISKATAPLRITGIRPTLKGYTFRRAKLSKVTQVPTVGFVKDTIKKLLGKNKEGKKIKKGKR